MNTDQHVLAWSKLGNAFRVRPLAAELQCNRSLYTENAQADDDYRLLIVGTKEECLQAAAASQQTLALRCAIPEASA